MFRPGNSWSFYGANYKAKAAGIPGDEAAHVTVSAKRANPWDAGATSDTVKPVGANDTLLLAVYLRAPDVAGGQALDVPVVIGEAAAPYGVVGRTPPRSGMTGCSTPRAAPPRPMPPARCTGRFTSRARSRSWS